MSKRCKLGLQDITVGFPKNPAPRIFMIIQKAAMVHTKREINESGIGKVEDFWPVSRRV